MMNHNSYTHARGSLSSMPRSVYPITTDLEKHIQEKKNKQTGGVDRLVTRVRFKNVIISNTHLDPINGIFNFFINKTTQHNTVAS